jgi:CRP-like cAMP-binding protein
MGDRWLLVAGEIRAVGEAKLCAEGLAALWPKIREATAHLPADCATGEIRLACSAPNCGAIFRIKRPAPENASFDSGENFALDDGTKKVRLTRRMERGATAAGAVLRDAGPFMARLPKEIISEFIAAAEMELHKPGAVIIRQGTCGEKLFVVGDGEVEVVRANHDGQGEVAIVTLGKGECFGEMSLLTGNPTSAAVRARTNVSVLVVSRDALEGLFVRHPALHRSFSKLLADRLKAANISLENEATRGFVGRLTMISLVDLTQTLNVSRRTGTLTLRRAGEEARVGFLDGRIVSAVGRDADGEEAFYQMMAWPEGDFSFDPELPEPRGAVYAEPLALLMEGLRRLDENRRAVTQNVPADE